MINYRNKNINICRVLSFCHTSGELRVSVDKEWCLSDQQAYTRGTVGGNMNSVMDRRSSIAIAQAKYFMFIFRESNGTIGTMITG